MTHKKKTFLASAATVALAASVAATAQPVDLTPPDVAASIRDNGVDGSPDSIAIAPASFSGLLRQTSSVEDRAIQEYDVSQFAGTTILSATISGRVSVNNSFDNGPRTFDFGIYDGDGLAQLSDFNAVAAVVGSGSYAPPTDSSFDYSFDVTTEVAAIVGGGGNWVGLLVDPTSSPNFPNILLDGENIAVLTIEAEAAAACPCDFDGMGPALPDGADFNAFLTAFFAGDPAADFDGMGPALPDGADFNAFLSCFFNPPAGCA